MAAQYSPALQVTGCTHETIGAIVNGLFLLYGDNHCRPVYKKTEQVKGFEVLIYFWDERDGPDFCGWWFGPKVGGDQVWAFHPDIAAVPPAQMWHVPYGGPVDNGFTVSAAVVQPGHHHLLEQPPPPPQPAPPAQQQVVMQPVIVQQQMVPMPAAQQPGVQTAQSQLQQLLALLPSHAQVLNQQQLQLVAQACLDQPQQVNQLLGSLLQQHQQAQAQAQQQQLGMQAQIQQMQAIGNIGGVQQLQATFQAQATQQQQQQLGLQQHHLQQLAQLATNQQAQAHKLEETRLRQEQNRLRMLEEQRKRQEDHAKKMAEEQAQREAEAQRRMVEQKALSNIRRMLSKLRASVLDNHEAHQKELEEVVSLETTQNGFEMPPLLHKEIETSVEHVRRRIEQQRQQQELQKKQREEDVNRYVEAKQKAITLVKELLGLVEAAESTGTTLEEALAHLTGEEGATLESVDAACRVAVTAEANAKVAIKACTDFIVRHAAEMRDPRPPVGQVIAPPAPGPSETQKTLASLVTRINSAKEKQVSATSAKDTARDDARRRILAQQMTSNLKDMLERYDSDRDSMLSRADVKRYAKQEFGLDLPETLLASIFRADVESPLVQEGKKGVALESLQMVRVHVGIARELERDAKRRKLRKEKEDAFIKVIGKLAEKVNGLSGVISSAEERVAAAEKKVDPLVLRGLTMAPGDALSLADEGEKEAEKVARTISGAQAQWDKVLGGFDVKIADKLQEYLRSDRLAKKCTMRIGKLAERHRRMVQIVKGVRSQAKRKSDAELRKLTLSAVKVLRHSRRVRRLRPDQFFDAMDSKRDGQLDEQEFVAFLSAADLDIQTLQVEVATGDGLHGDALDAGGEAAGDGAEAEETAQAAGMSAEQGGRAEGGEQHDGAAPDPEAARQLDELLKSLAANGSSNGAASPLASVQETRIVERAEQVQLPAEELPRLFAHLLQEGCQTISRESLLGLIRVCYTVLRPPGGGARWEARPLQAGEVVEVVEGPEEDAASKELRVLAKTMGDDAEGWLTVVSSDGSELLKEGGQRLRVLRDTPLTASHSVGGAVVRMLSPGERLAVEEWPARDVTSGCMRAKVTTLSFGAATGFVTTFDPQGTMLVELDG